MRKRGGEVGSLSDVEHGLARAFTEVIGGFITSFALRSVLVGFANSGFLGSSWLALFDLVSVAGTFSLLRVMNFWKTPYLMGWIIGVGLLLQTGLLGSLEILIYLVVPVLVLLARI
jgi:hypothetical protein